MNKFIFSDTKQHYEILDGLRGVASITVVLFHVFEIFSNADHTKQIINHGYLGVDFFFLLSGFVIAHAYDDRWGTMTLVQFLKRRLVRLHPLIIVGMTLGAICFYWSGSPMLFRNVAGTPVSTLLLVLFLGYLLIPVPLSLDIRGWTEMYPLNGPAWSLFYEYVANILYALVLRKTSTKVLAFLVVLAGIALAYYTINSPKGDIIGGWALTEKQIQIGLTRLMYPFLMGLLLSRLFKPMPIKNGFLWCSALVVLFLAMPRIGGYDNLWLNGVYDSFTIIVVFPIIIFLGANGRIENKTTATICNFLGDISYPLYITHFPIAYVFYAWVVDNKISLEQAIPMGILAVVVSIVLSYLAFKFYDVPVRKWLTKKFIA